MSALTRWVSYLSSLGVGLSGFVLIWMVYVLLPEDPYAIVNHPTQPLWKNLHIWLAPILTLNIGYLWSQHAWRYWRGTVKKGRISGIILLTTSLPMILSAYFLQTAISEIMRTFWSLFHIMFSLAWILSLLIHISIHIRDRST